MAGAGRGIEPHALAQLGERLGPSRRCTTARRRGCSARRLIRAGARPRARGAASAAAARPAGRGRSRGGCAPRHARRRARTASASCVARGGQVAACRRLLARADEIVGRTRRGGGPALARGRALLLQRDAERVVALAQLGVELERPLERGDRAGQVAVLPERLAELVVDGGVRRDRQRRRDAGARARASEIALLAQREPEVQVRARGCSGSSASAFWKTATASAKSPLVASAEPRFV